MAKKETEKEISPNSSDSKEPLIAINLESEKQDQNFRIPTITSKYKSTQKKLKKVKKNKISSELKHKEDMQKHKKGKKRSKKTVEVEIASDKNIATLLRSERLLDFLKKGCKIPYEIGRNISQKTGFKSVNDLNAYISAHRNEFIVLVDRKEKYCENETSKCNNSMRRADSVDLNLYFSHHYGDTPKSSET